MERHKDGTPNLLAPEGPGSAGWAEYQAERRGQPVDHESSEPDLGVPDSGSPLTTILVEDVGFRSDVEKAGRTFSSVEFDSAADPRTILTRKATAIGQSTEVGVLDGKYVDSITEVVSISRRGSEPEAERYICTFAGSLSEDAGTIRFDYTSSLRGPQEVNAYCIQLAIGEEHEYSDIIIRPDRRSQAEAIHKAAVDAYQSGARHQQVYDRVLGFARELGVEVIAG